MGQTEIAQLIRTLSVGVYGIGVKAGEETRIFTASWVMPVSFNPVLVAVSVNPLGRSYALMKRSGCFSVNVIGKDHAALANLLASPGDRFHELEWSPSGLTGCPIIENALAHLECRIRGEYPAGDHQLMIAEVISGGFKLDSDKPLLYEETGNLDGATTLFPHQLSEAPLPET